jgi:3-dehydroquinate synthase
MSKVIKVNLKNNSYKIFIGTNIINNIDKYHKEYFNNRSRIVIYDKILSNSIYLKKLIKKLGNNTNSISVSSGEKSKSIDGLNNLYNKLFSHNVDRNSVIYAFGGGVIGDLAGFAASTYMRGIDYVQVPTTLLSLIDSSVGGKTAINSSFGKNLIGSFYQPKLVLADINTLDSLPKKQMISGYSEMVKYGLINNKKFFLWLEKNGQNILEKNKKDLEYGIYICCKSKAEIVKKDEKEKDKRALLNLGHTFGHALERMANFKRFTHGEAVAVGTILAFKYSYELNYCKEEDLNRVNNHFNDMKLPNEINHLFKNNVKANDIINSMKLDKKTVNSIIKLILVKGIGKAFIYKQVNEKHLSIFLKKNGLN